MKGERKHTSLACPLKQTSLIVSVSVSHLFSFSSSHRAELEHRERDAEPQRARRQRVRLGGENVENGRLADAGKDLFLNFICYWFELLFVDTGQTEWAGHVGY